ncbi:MAG: M23 family metallopeptidase [Solirubrobacterales bacterium]
MSRRYKQSIAPRRWAAVLLSTGASLAVLGSGSALASTGGATPPGGTTPPPTTTPVPAPSSSASYTFPIQGAHTFGQGFGAARSGHSHQGQDIMAACGTPLIAASRSVVRMKRKQRLAGNYIVLRDQLSRQDYMYAHMLGPGVVTKGQKLTPGQLIGYVGQTGDATVCHLHFELWLPPGWYKGGKPTNPLPVLQAWDATS